MYWICKLFRGLLVGAVVVAPLPLRAQEQRRPEPDNAAIKAVGQLLGRLLEAVTQDRAAGSQEAAPEPAFSRDALDERAVVNREQQARYERGVRLLNEGEPRLGMRYLQNVLEAGEDSLLLSDEGVWRSLHGVVEETILNAPPAAMEAYQQLYATVAENQLAHFGDDGDVRALAVITRRYIATPAGQIAADRIASLMLDAGRPAEAAYWLQRLLDADAPLTNDDAWCTKAALAFRLLDRPLKLESGATRQDKPLPVANARDSENRAARLDERSEWTQPFGGPTHRGTTPASRPVLIPRWSQPLTGRPHIAEQVTHLIDDLQDSGRACIPAAVPLGVDGKVVFRTFRGMSVVDVASGRILWEAPQEVSLERLLSGEPAVRPATKTGPSRIQPMSDYERSGDDQHHLANVLFRDGVYGLLSSDGERVFVLEDHATLSYGRPGYFRGQPRSDDPHGRDWASNRLTAYDLDTGRRMWSAGGPRQADLSSSGLTDTLFHGPPVVDGDELFLIGEHRGGEYLYVLDRRTGRLLWLHMLAGVSAEIQHDLVRRWWPAQAAVGKGVILCPTTVGWMVAIDRHERRIRWAHRLIERRERHRQSHQATVFRNGPLNTRWAPAAPVLAGDRVVFTPSELPDSDYHTSPHVVCLDVLTGEPRWHEGKGNGLYLGGVFVGRVVLVGSDRVEARKLDNGRLTWKTSLPPTAGPPCGRGIANGSDYLLPLQSGEVWRLNLEDGTVTERSKLRGAERSLGNLLVYRDRLLSLSALSITCFENRDSMESLLAQIDREPLDAEEKLSAAELQMIDGRYASAVEILRKVDGSSLDSDAAQRCLALRREALIAVAEKDPASAADALAELEALADRRLHLLKVRDLQAARAAAVGEHREAFDVYWDLAQTPAQNLVDDGETSVRLDRWLADRLNRAWTAMSAEQRREVDAQIEATVASLLNSPSADGHAAEMLVPSVDPPSPPIRRSMREDVIRGRGAGGEGAERPFLKRPLTPALSPASARVVHGQSIAGEREKNVHRLSTHTPSAACMWWSEVLGFHSQGRRLDEHLAERALQANRLAEAEVRLLRLLDDADADGLHRDALGRLVELLRRNGRADDAAAYLAEHHSMIAEEEFDTPKESDTADTETPPPDRPQPREPADVGSGAVIELETAAQNEAAPNQEAQREEGALARAPHDDWASEEFTLSRTNTAFNQQQARDLLHVEDGVPSLDRVQLQRLSKLQRLKIVTLTGERVWETPLRSQSQPRFGQSTDAGAIGQLLFLVHGDVLHAMSVPDREMLWQRTLDIRLEASPYERNASHAPPPQMAAATTFGMSNRLQRRPPPTGLLAVCRPEYVCYFGRNSLTAADPLTGATLWTRRGINPQSVVHGNDRHVYVIPPQPARPFALSVDNGSMVDLPQLDERLAEAIGIDDEGLVTMDTSLISLLGLRRRHTRLKVVDLQTGEDAWETTFPAETLFSRIDADEIAALEPDGTVRLVNWSQRLDRMLGRIDASNLREARSVHAVADSTHLYLSVSGPSEGGYWSDAIRSVPVNGTLTAFDRTTGGLVWQENIDNQNLLLDHLDALPVLVLHARRAAASPSTAKVQQVHLHMLDKWSGRELLDTVRYVSPGRFTAIDFDLPARIIDLRTYSERLRIQPHPGERGT